MLRLTYYSLIQSSFLVYACVQGIQAQTVANFYLAFEQGLDLIPVLNKIDLPSAEPERVIESMAAAFDVSPASVLRCSAKTGLGVDQVLPAVIQ